LPRKRPYDGGVVQATVEKRAPGTSRHTDTAYTSEMHRIQLYINRINRVTTRQSLSTDKERERIIRTYI